ncbi:hypothetical protein NM688_g7260 [Phlebia brevispora]|uniref:Uncharacterized protein n=1 Tax=Phlebia brevispora TaxID=194682 RepID=A0ACC1S7I8_9APHY|nr:hypothetical protein NM688_g7260 [Phlebia brevispora]
MPPGGNRKEPPIGKVSTPFGVARELPYAEFMEELLPLLDPRIDFNTLTLNTQKRRSNLPMTKNSHLWGYSTKKPSTKRSLGIEPTLVFKNNDNAEWTLEKRDMDALPDAYLLLRSSSEEDVNWTSIAVPGAYSIWDTPDTFRENVVKITRCMSQCMYRDARRRFVYAFTIQDERMRLWWCDRVKILFTESFDCIAHSVLLFEFFISVMYAPPERLGFDPTMKLLNHPRDNVHLAQYEISVRSEDGEEHQYKTLALLADAEETILGRNTRVWKAIKIENGVPVGEPVVLKDAWVHPYRDREGAIYSRVWTTASEAQRNALEAACISVLCHGDVFVCESPDCAMYYKDALRCRNRGAARAIEAHASQCEAHHLIHNRVVFKQIGRSMLGETSLAKIFGGLRDAANALQVLHECGWIHGDISTGNILLVNDRAVLTDLEYAQHKDERRNHDKTGALQRASKTGVRAGSLVASALPLQALSR